MLINEVMLTKKQVVEFVISMLEKLQEKNRWPVKSSILEDFVTVLRQIGINPVDFDAAIKNPEKQKQYLITGPSAPGGGGNGALNDLKKMLKK